MALLSWNDTYSVKIRKFDDQHKKLIDLINQLHDSMLVGKGKDVMGEVMNSLVDYTKTHFTAEETLMRLHNYPDYESQSASRASGMECQHVGEDSQCFSRGGNGV